MPLSIRLRPIQPQRGRERGRRHGNHGIGDSYRGRGRTPGRACGRPRGLYRRNQGFSKETQLRPRPTLRPRCTTK